jgi:hypothetical protein
MLEIKIPLSPILEAIDALPMSTKAFIACMVFGCIFIVIGFVFLHMREIPYAMIFFGMGALFIVQGMPFLADMIRVSMPSLPPTWQTAMTNPTWPISIKVV